MIVQTPPLEHQPAWSALAADHERLRNVHLRQLFADDPGRGEDEQKVIEWLSTAASVPGFICFRSEPLCGLA